MLGVQLSFIRVNQPEAQTNRKHKPTGSTNQPEAQIRFIELSTILVQEKV